MTYTLCTSGGSAAIADVCDVYLRIAEAHAIRADLSSETFQTYGYSGERPDILRGSRVNDAGFADVEFCRSLALFESADRLRLQNFALHPLESDFFVSGHPMRQSIRVALKLEKTRRRSLRVSGSEAGFFVTYARRAADTLTRHLFRYPRERASQLILESTMLRLLSPKDGHETSLKTARLFLARAEPMILALGRRARIGMRLSLERAKVNRYLALTMRPGSMAREVLLQHCEYDVGLLEALSDELRSPLWLSLTHVQRGLLDLAKLPAGTLSVKTAATG